MVYTWGYIKDVALAKLDLTEDEAQAQNLMGRFPFYANEVITQVSSAIKPKSSYLQVNVFENVGFDYLELEYLAAELNKHLKANKPLDWNDTIHGEFTLNDLTDAQLALWEKKLSKLKQDFSRTNTLVGNIVPKPRDIVSWGGDEVLYQEVLWDEHGGVRRMYEPRNASDEDFKYLGDNGLIFYKPGIYLIPYGSRWIMFTKDLDNDTELDIPHDILDCIPSYIAHQCYKIDDEAKSAIFRNEYELFMSRIDDTDFKSTKTLKIAGGW